MAARIMDGKKTAEDIRRELALRIVSLSARGLVPGLAVILVGEDPASLSYVTGKERSCAELGIASLGELASRVKGDDEDAGQNGDQADDDQNFDEGKTFFMRQATWDK